jgi:hypothetical protein
MDEPTSRGTVRAFDGATKQGDHVNTYPVTFAVDHPSDSSTG